MECKMTVFTPAGQARKSAGKFQLVGMFKPKGLEVAEDDASFTFLIEAPLKKVLKIMQRCQMFQTMAKSVINQKVTRLAITKEQRPQLEKFIEQTNIKMEVITPATVEEVADCNTSVWEKFKRWF